MPYWNNPNPARWGCEICGKPIEGAGSCNIHGDTISSKIAKLTNLLSKHEKPVIKR